jgi:ACS family hexuronate transporter-like MFS transporter
MWELGGMAGGLGGIIMAKTAGTLFDHYKAVGQVQEGYATIFIWCGIAYVIAWMGMFIVLRKKNPA